MNTANRERGPLQGENALLIKDRILELGRGALVELHRAIPVPNKDVPLNDILEFKAKRADELLQLRSEIDSLFTAVNNAADKAFELHRQIAKIDTACADLLRIAKEWKFSVRLSDLAASFELRPFDAAIPGAIIWGATQNMPLAAAIAAGASIKITPGFGMNGIKLRSSPYRYMYQFHKDLF